MRQLYPPRHIFLGERNIVCESAEDFELLQEARAIERDFSTALKLSIGRLHLVKDACERYSFGKHQRLISQAIKSCGR